MIRPFPASILSRNYLSNHHQAVILKLLSFLLFAWNNALSKSLSAFGEITLNVYSLLLFQYALATVILTVYLGGGLVKRIGDLKYPKLHCLRGTTGLCGLVLLHTSFKKLPLLQATGFNVLGPILGVLLSTLFLKESLCRKKCAALFTGASAYILLLAPGSVALTAGLSYDVLLPSIALLCFQANTLLTKSLSRANENQTNMLLSTLLIVTVCLLPGVVANPQLPSPYQFSVLTVMSVNLVLALLCLNYAISLTQVSLLIPLSFAKQGLNALFGWLYFMETPQVSHILGIILGISSVALISTACNQKPAKYS